MKKIIGIVLSMIMLISTLPQTAVWAADNKCGDNLTWNLDTEGTLTVSGTGDMYDYSESNPAPWKDSNDKIKKIILSDGVASIGNYAFYPYKYSSLTMDVTESFKKIGDNAFVEVIDNEHGWIFGRLDSINYSGTAEDFKNISIGTGNTALQYVMIYYDKVKEPVFGTYQDEDADSVDIKWTIDTNGTLTLSGNGSMPFEKFGGWPNEDGFYDNVIKKIIVEEGITGIRNFDFLKNLEEVTLPSTLNTVLDNCFEEDTKLKNIYYNGTEEEWNKLFESGAEYKIPENTTIHFNNVSSAEEEKLYQYEVNDGKATITAVDKSISGDITIPSTLGGYPVESIGNEVFRDCNKITTIVIPESVKSIGYSNFTYCDSLEQITIPGELEFEYGNEVFGTNQFYKCTKLKEIKVSGNSTKYAVENGILFSKDKKTLIAYPPGKQDIAYTVPSNVEKIGISAFESCNNLKAIIISEGVVSIDSMSLWCDNLEILALPKTAVEFGEYQYWGNEKPIDVYYAGTQEEYDSKIGKHFKERVTLHYGCTAEELAGKYDFLSKISEDTTLHTGEASNDEAKNQLVLVIGKTDATVFGETKANDVAPVIRNDRTMLPARFVAESLGAVVEWNEVLREVLIKGKKSNGNDIIIKIYINSDAAYVNDEKVTLDSQAFIENDRTYTPVRFIAEALGAKVDWNEEEHKVIITRK